MKKYVLLTSSLVLILMGILIEDRGLVMHVTSGGEAIYPVSSGSDDGAILKLGLYSFVITAFYSVVSIFRGHRERTLFIVYLANSLIYAFFLFLVILDSSIISAAELGDWYPLAANILWILSFTIYGALSYNRASTST